MMLVFAILASYFQFPSNEFHYFCESMHPHPVHLNKMLIQYIFSPPIRLLHWSVLWYVLWESKTYILNQVYWIFIANPTFFLFLSVRRQIHSRGNNLQCLKLQLCIIIQCGISIVHTVAQELNRSIPLLEYFLNNTRLCEKEIFQ